ncbi:MAG: spore germination protein [Eubacteriales bacterium]|jgi:spore germination protein KA
MQREKGPGLWDWVRNRLAFDQPQRVGPFAIPRLGDAGENDPEERDFGEATQRQNTPVTGQLEKDLAYVKEQFCSDRNPDLIVRRLRAGDRPVAVLYIDGMSSRVDVSDFIIRPLSRQGLPPEEEQPVAQALLDVVEVGNVQAQASLDEGIRGLLMGDSLVLVQGASQAFVCETKGYERRSVNIPQTEGAVKAPQEAFTENLKTNTTLVRRIIKNPRLVVEYTMVGDVNRSSCAVLYIDGLCNPAIVEEVKRRLDSLRGDFIFGSGMLEQFIEDNPFSIFPSVLSTERPDKVAANLNEGRVGIILDGSPFGVVVPMTLSSMLTTTEDTSLRWQYGTLTRIIRCIALFASIYLPALYVALTNFHQEMIPTDILIAIAQARENVPFPSVVEAFLMVLSFDLIREASTRVPGIIGNSIGIVGALILGQASVEANLVSPILIIIVAFTGMGSFALPDYSFTFGVRLLRIFLLLCGVVMGFVGIALGTVITLALMVGEQSFGVDTLVLEEKEGEEGGQGLVFRRPVWQRELRSRRLHPLYRRNQPRVSRPWTKEPPKWHR